MQRNQKMTFVAVDPMNWVLVFFYFLDKKCFALPQTTYRYFFIIEKINIFFFIYFFVNWSFVESMCLMQELKNKFNSIDCSSSLNSSLSTILSLLKKVKRFLNKIKLKKIAALKARLTQMKYTKASILATYKD